MMAKAAGVSEAEATNNLIAQSDHPRTAAILTFVKQVVVNRGVASDTEVAQLREVGVNDAEFVEILAHVGINLFANYFNNIVETDIDFPFTQAQKAAA
jgi:alkylhydroperoxidase family enzyme